MTRAVDDQHKFPGSAVPDPESIYPVIIAGLSFVGENKLRAKPRFTVIPAGSEASILIKRSRGMFRINGWIVKAECLLEFLKMEPIGCAVGEMNFNLQIIGCLAGIAMQLEPMCDLGAERHKQVCGTRENAPSTRHAGFLLAERASCWKREKEYAQQD